MNHFEIGQVYFKNQRYEEAIVSYSKAILIDSLQPTFYLQRSLCYRFLENLDLALQDLCNACLLDPDESLYPLHKGLVYFRQCSYHQSLRCFLISHRLGNTHAYLWVMKCRHKIQKQIEDFQKDKDEEEESFWDRDKEERYQDPTAKFSRPGFQIQDCKQDIGPYDLLNQYIKHSIYLPDQKHLQIIIFARPLEPKNVVTVEVIHSHTIHVRLSLIDKSIYEKKFKCGSKITPTQITWEIDPYRLIVHITNPPPNCFSSLLFSKLKRQV